MLIRISLLVLFVLLTGCQPPKPKTLAEARKGFVTKLMRQERANEPLPEPPAELFKVVQFDSSVGPLAAYLTPDPGDGQKHPAIVWITGGDTSTLGDGVWVEQEASNDQSARQFREAGLVMMFPTQRGGNQNPGYHEGLFGEIDDILAAGKFLAGQSYVDPQRIYLGGHSSGGTAVLLAAESSDQFRAAFAIGPSADLLNAPPNYNAIFKTFDASIEKEVELRKPVNWLSSVQNPLFVFAGAANDGALGSVRFLEQRSQNPLIKFGYVAGADHFDLLVPLNRRIAEKILQDTGPECNMVFSQDELDRLMTK